MSEITELKQINFQQLILWIFLIMAAFVACGGLLMKFFDMIGIEFKWMRKHREDHNFLIETSENLIALQKSHEEAVNNAISHDKEIRRDLQKFTVDIQEQIKTLSDNVSTMSADIEKRFSDNEEREKKRVRAELKDRIGQSYKYHHATGKINDMEFDALNDLITEYEDNGGENSFVHTAVQPEMYTWERI